MSRVLVLDDDPEQVALTRLMLKSAGHEVLTAPDTRSAAAQAFEGAPDVLLMDLNVPRASDGRGLIRDLKARGFKGRIVVFSGWPEELYGTPEAQAVERILPKPVAMATLMAAVRKLAVVLCCVGPVFAQTFAFQVSRQIEIVAEMEMASPGADWSQAGREAALAELRVDGGAPQHVMLFAGAERHTYRAFLGRLAPGSHELRIARNAKYSAAGAGLEVTSVRFREDDSPELAHAPILYARADTVGGFSDVPLAAYCERLTGGGRPLVEYTVIFSNEDGGTSTRALMARWGRTTDIEYIYRVWLGPDGAVRRATIQTRDHKEVEFRGRREGAHPVLIPVTRNNMVAPGGASPIRYQLPPVAVDLSAHSREQVMDEHPVLYRVMAQELAREGKLRAAGKPEGENISDPRHYLYLEAKVANRRSAVAAAVRLEGERVWRTGHLGRADYAISRDGWVRTAIELPPGAPPVAELGFECLVPPSKSQPALFGTCRVEAVSRVFPLGPDYRPGPDLWRLAQPFELPTGQMRVWPVGGRASNPLSAP
ncbi:MAG: response regulator [Bryobacteraceae bacterium]